MGVRLRISPRRSPYRDEEYCLPVCTHLGQDPTVTRISELNTIQGGSAKPYLSSSLPFCVRFNVAFRPMPYNNAATLDTEPPAKSYSGGSLTHLSSNHFQYARSSHCYPTGNSCSGRIRHVRANPICHLIDISLTFGELNDCMVFFLITCDQIQAVEQ